MTVLLELLGCMCWRSWKAFFILTLPCLRPIDADLDYCGPIPFLEAKMRQPDVTTDDSPAFARRTNDDDGSGSNLSKRWLYLTQIGEDSAPCLAEPNSASKSRSSYSFADYIIIQCATYSDNAADYFQYVHLSMHGPLSLSMSSLYGW